MSPAEQRRRLGFEYLVFKALWLLILFACGQNPRTWAIAWRADAIGYLDEHGTQGPGAKEYRRGENGLPDLYGERMEHPNP